MKKIVFGLIALGAIVCTGCNQNSYSAERKAEKKLIANYIAREGLNILDEEPAQDYEWGEKDYFEIPGYEGMYYHQIKAGDSIAMDGADTVVLGAFKSGETVLLRYKQFTLTETPDTISYWSTINSANPLEFAYLTADKTEASTGWQLAVRQMKFHGAQCQVIIPSTLGFTAEQNSVTPYGYIMEVKKKL